MTVVAKIDIDELKEAVGSLLPKPLKYKAKPKGRIYQYTNVLVSISPQKFTFLIYDTNTTLRISLDADANGVANFIISARQLYSFAQSAKNFVEISVREPDVGDRPCCNVVDLKTTEITMRVKDSHHIDDFHKMSKKSPPSQNPCIDAISTTERELHRALTLGRHCISPSTFRLNLGGAFLTQKPDDDTLRVVTTDGHRMAIIDTPIPLSQNIGTLPAAALDRITSYLNPDRDGPVSIHHNETWITVSIHGFELKTKMLEETFPDYIQVIPDPSDTMSVQISENNIKHLSRIRKTCGKGCAKYLTFDTEQGNITLKGWDDSTVSTPITSTGDFKVSVNLRYIKDQAAITPEFTLQYINDITPMRCTSADPDALFLIMPIEGAKS